MVSNKENTLNKFNNELTRLKNLGLEGFEPIEFKNPFLEGVAHDLWELVIEKEAEKIATLFETDDFMRDHNLKEIIKNQLDQAYPSSEERKMMGIKTNVDYRNVLLNFQEKIVEYNLTAESKKWEFKELTPGEWDSKNKELEERVKQLEEKEKKLELRVTELEEEVLMEREEAERALEKSKEWRLRQMKEVKSSHRKERKKLLKIIERLQGSLERSDTEIKNLEESKNWKTYKFKQLVSKVGRVKNKVQEKFQAFVVQKNK